MESLVNAQAAGYPAKEGEESNCEHSFSTTLDLDGQCEFMGADSVVVLDTGAAASLARLRSLEHRNKILASTGTDDLKLAMVAKEGYPTPQKPGKFAAFALEADIPALLRKGALEALGGQVDFSRGLSPLRKQGVRTPLQLNHMGRYVLSAVALGRPQSNFFGRVFRVSLFEGTSKFSLWGITPALDGGWPLSF